MKPAAWLTLGVLVPLLAGQRPAGGPAATVRLHHLHVRGDDLAAALSAASRTHGGIRTIVPGLGAGIRVEDVYLLIDRPEAGQPAVPPGPGAAVPSIANRFIAAARWLGLHHVEVSVSEAGRRMLINASLDEGLDHIGLAAENVEAVEQIIRSAGAAPVRRTADSVFYLADGTLIEVTRETERPDTLWCPMHPDVRSSSAAKCPICAMELVPIAPPRVGQYRLDVSPVAAANGRGIRALKLRIRDPDSKADVAMFAEAHERLLHLFIIGRDLRYFAHEHPEQLEQGFELKIDLPEGAYVLIADFVPGGGYPQMVHRAIVTPGYQASPFAVVADPAEDLADKLIDGMRVQLKADQVIGRAEAVLRFRFTEAATGAPVRDLQLYLGSSGHLLIVSPDLTHSVHAHPEGRTSGPDINFGVVFPEAGVYKLWIQVQRAGKVTSVPFVVRLIS